jgi:phosphatidylserine/phosphatidylglycerophosphate/cardiolipin synthase-like enzyme
LGSRALHGSDSSLHSKAMIFDRQKSFIGSFNFDPRSVLWNTEVGVLVDSPELAEHVRNLALQGMAPALSYEAKLQDGQVVWVTEDNGQLHTLTREPGSWWRRLQCLVQQKCGPGAHALSTTKIQSGSTSRSGRLLGAKRPLAQQQNHQPQGPRRH